MPISRPVGWISPAMNFYPLESESVEAVSPSYMRMNKKGNLCWRETIPKRWEPEYLKTSQCLSSAIGPSWIWRRAIFTRRRGLSTFYGTEKKSPCERKSVMRPGFYVSQFTAHESTQMQYTSWLCMMPWKLCMWKTDCWGAKRDVKTLLSFHFVSLQQMCTPSQLIPQGWGTQFLNFLHIHLQLTRRACQSTDGKFWMNYISEREFPPFIPCMMPQLLLCTETTWKHLLVGTNVLCDKDQGSYS